MVLEQVQVRALERVLEREGLVLELVQVDLVLEREDLEQVQVEFQMQRFRKVRQISLG